ncbi:hypothetical protein DFS34DRAFT_464392 [Phlyctochytrium arcticum]|nr:hypothetical protein DFS34DRAFT_464392 [Phlyctochytrium arcticum]
MPAPLKRETTVRFEGSGEDTSSEASLGVHNAPEESDRDVYADRYSKDNESPSGQEEYLKDDVPDPDMEHKLARLETRRWDVETGPRGMRSTLSRALKGITRTPSITSSNPSYSRPGRSTDLSASPERNAEGEAVRMENLRQSQEPDGTMYPSDSETRDASIPNPPGAPIRRGTTGSTTTDVSDGADLIRKNTLPIHPQYVSPTFRSIPTWFPVRGRVVAWALLIITSAVSVANIIVAIAGVG